MQAEDRTQPRVVAQFVALALTWGSSFLLIKVALAGVSPGQVVLARLCLGALALVAVSLVVGARVPTRPGPWLHLAVVATFLCVLPFLGFAWAEQEISSGLASIYNATTPLMTMLVALAALPGERPTPGKLAGLAVGFLGVATLFEPWQGFTASGTAAQLACVGATSCYGVAFVYLRRFVAPLGLGALSVATMQVSSGAAMMLAVAPFALTDAVALSWPVVGSLVVLGTLGTGLAYVWNTNIVSAWGATPASTVTYLTPLVGVLLGVAVLSEPVGWNQPAGGLLIVLGVVLSRSGSRTPAPGPASIRPVATAGASGRSRGS